MFVEVNKINNKKRVKLKFKLVCIIYILNKLGCKKKLLRW